MKKPLIVVLLLFLLSIVNCQLSIVESVFAQEKNAFSLGIYPPLLEINALPPADVEAEIHIQNLSDIPQNLKIIFKSFRPGELGDGTLRYINEDIIEGPDPLVLQQVKVYDLPGGEAGAENPIEEIQLDPFESRNFKLKMNLDKDSPFGDYYFSVIFVSSKEQTSEGSQTQIPGGIGTNVILSVGEKGPTSGEIKEFSIPRILGSGPVPITLHLQNNSNHYVVPTGRIIIRDMLGREAGQINILPQYILANSARFMVDTDQASPSAELEEQIKRLSEDHSVLIWPKKFLFGPYTAHARVKLSENGPVFETKTSFFALPIYMLFAISFIAFVLIGIYLRVKRKI